MKSFFHKGIPFLPLISSCQLRILDSIQFLCSQAHVLAGWRLETRLNWTLVYNHFARTTQKTPPLYCWEGVFTAPLHINESYSICCLRIRCRGSVFTESLPSNNVYSVFAIPAFRRHVTIHFRKLHRHDQWTRMRLCCSSECTLTFLYVGDNIKQLYLGNRSE
jgi:hypothetical protein